MDNKVAAALLKLTVTNLAETRALLNTLLIIHNKPGDNRPTLFLKDNHKENREQEIKSIYEQLYAEYGELPDEVKDILNG